MKEVAKKTLNFLINLFSAFGLLWLIVEIVDYFGTTATSEKIKSFWWLFGLLGLGYAICKLIPKKKFTFKVPNRDANVNIISKDIFKIKGSLLITINNKFLVNQDGALLKVNSILSQFVKKNYQSKPELLQAEINSKLQSDFYNSYKISEHEYKIGTTVLITVENVNYYLFVNTKLNAQNKSYCDKNMFEESLNELWVYLSECASKENFIIPLIGTGNGRLLLSREKVFKEIVLSFISSLSSKNYADSLTICIHPTDLKRHDLDLTKFAEFTNAKVTYREYRLSSEKGQNTMPNNV
ncbi:MAG: hypothetical protein JXR48_18685 [Candidatus Delongbacteria bacterium]|nr:hypothetical protein [Candidatus Delongbacteria bacterium]MBN2836986.1 hypothetical protein [Candidatus Delongbacteria bacterium]